MKITYHMYVWFVCIVFPLSYTFALSGLEIYAGYTFVRPTQMPVFGELKLPRCIFLISFSQPNKLFLRGCRNISLCHGVDYFEK